MYFWILAAVMLQDPPKPAPSATGQQKQKPEKVVVDPNAPRTLKDEDESVAAANKEYTLDPAQAKKELTVGDFYMRRGSVDAAAKRYEEATKWNPKWPLAYLKLGQSLEKKDDPVRAAQAYRKYLELSPHDKQQKELQKKIDKLEKDAEK